MLTIASRYLRYDDLWDRILMHHPPVRHRSSVFRPVFTGLQTLSSCESCILPFMHRFLPISHAQRPAPQSADLRPGDPVRSAF